MTRKQTLAMTLPVLAVLVVGWFVVWSPARSDAATAREERTELDGLNDAAMADIDYAREFAEDPSAREELDALRRAVPDHTAMNEFIAEHSALATGAGVIVSSFVPDLPSAESDDALLDAASTGLSITVIGTLDQTMDYLDALGASSRLVVVDSLDVTAETESTLATALRARIFDTDVAASGDLELDEFGEPIDGEFEDATEDDIISGE